MMTVLLLLALSLSVWLMRQSFFSLDEVSNSHPTTPDAFMVAPDYTAFAIDGQWNNRIHAARITHYADKDTSVLSAPKMVSRSDTGITWTITADQGIAQHGLKTVQLTDHVVMDRMHALNGKMLTLNTTALTAYPQQKLAQTNQPVVIVQPGSQVHATGLTADMNTGDIHLLSRVWGTYTHRP